MHLDTDKHTQIRLKSEVSVNVLITIDKSFNIILPTGLVRIKSEII